MRRDFYVYLHRDDRGNIFYVGKGTGRRAWSKDRHSVWNKYVQERLGGKYKVEIYEEDLSEQEAEQIEGALIARLGNQLVNWINPGRQFDYEAIAEFHRLRKANRKFVAETKSFESENMPIAIERYYQALDSMREYESMTLERGLVAELGGGPDWGEPNILNRLTVCLDRTGKYSELVAVVERYFSEFPSAANLAVGKQILKRVEKARRKLELSNA